MVQGQANGIVGGDIYSNCVPFIIRAGNATARLVVHVEGSDINSYQVSCLVEAEYTGSQSIRRHSVRPLDPAGTALRQEVDFASPGSKTTRVE